MWKVVITLLRSILHSLDFVKFQWFTFGPLALSTRDVCLETVPCARLESFSNVCNSASLIIRVIYLDGLICHEYFSLSPLMDFIVQSFIRSLLHYCSSNIISMRYASSLRLFKEYDVVRLLQLISMYILNR